MGLLRTVLISTVLTLLLARYLYQELPSGFSQPTLVRIFGMAMKVVFDQALIGHTIGINGAAHQRRTLNAVTSLGAYIAQAPKCTRTQMKIDGIPVLMYKPPGMRKGELLRTLVYFHGGGWTICSPEAYSEITDRLAYELNAVVFSVDYRLAPENPFPAAFDDCVTVVKYVINNAKTYNVDVMRLGVAGDSAGGNLAAAVSLKLRDDKFKPMPKVQILLMPTLQLLNFDTPSFQYNHETPVLTHRWMVEWGTNYAFGNWKHLDLLKANNHTSPAMKKKLTETYLNPDVLPYDIMRSQYKPQPLNQGDEAFWKEHEKLFMNPYLNPLMATNLKGLPPAYISSCKYDVLRDDAYFYAHRLREAKVEVQHECLNACLHAWLIGNSVIDDFNNNFIGMVNSIDKML